MKIAIAGSTGFIGEAIVQALPDHGHTPVRLVRGRHDGDDILWDPANHQLDPTALNGIDAVICLSGENIAGRWSKAKKQAILKSRVDSASLLATAMAKASSPPKTFICASAIGYYGDRGDEILDESSVRGESFLADVCEAWEGAAQPAIDAGIRTVTPRIGVVLHPSGGMLKQLTPLFKTGLGGPIGSGKQYMSWIALDDLVRIVLFALENESTHGPMNATAPNPVTNREFTKALGRALGRPTLLPVPAFAVKAALGEAGEELALASARAVPQRLLSLGFHFNHPEIGPTLEEMFKRG